MNKYEIEIVVNDYGSYIESFVDSWGSKDLFFSMRHNDNEERIFSAYSPHIENIKNDSELVSRIISLNILVNGSLFVASANTNTKIEFLNYYIENESTLQTIEKNNFNGFWTNSIEDYPFDNSEEYYFDKNNRNLTKEKIGLDCMLFSISKFDFIIRTLLFQAGVILNNGINDKDTILTKKTRNMIWTPHNNFTVDHTTKNDFERHFNSYGLGWGLSDYHGKLRVGHTGGFDGMITAITLIPDENLGVVVLTNGMKSPIMAATYTALDKFLNVESKDWSADLLKRRNNYKKKDSRISDRIEKRILICTFFILLNSSRPGKIIRFHTMFYSLHITICFRYFIHLIDD